MISNGKSPVGYETSCHVTHQCITTAEVMQRAPREQSCREGLRGDISDSIEIAPDVVVFEGLTIVIDYLQSRKPGLQSPQALAKDVCCAVPVVVQEIKLRGRGLRRSRIEGCHERRYADPARITGSRGVLNEPE